MRISWDKYEVALLIDTYLITKDLSGIEKQEFYLELSSQLRQRAINMGSHIDDKFRNQNGIAMRIANIQYLFTGIGLSAYSTLDAVMCDMYLNNNKEFIEIINEAKSMVEGDKNTGISHHLFDKRKLDILCSAPIVESTGAEDDATSVQISYNRSESVSVCTDASILSVNFVAPLNLAYSKPVSLCIWGNEHPVRNWQSVYYEICEMLILQFPDSFGVLKDKSLIGNGRVDFTFEPERHGMARPKMLSNGMFYESNYSATDLMKRVKTLLDYFQISYQDCVVQYSLEREPHHSYVSAGQSIGAQLTYRKYTEWLISEGFSINTARSYASAIKASSDFAILRGIANMTVCNIKSKDEMNEFLTLLFADQEFAKLNASQHNRHHAALQKYSCFLEHKNSTLKTTLSPIVHSVRIKGIEVPLKQRAFRDWLLSKGFAPNSVSNYVSAVNTASQFAIDHNITGAGIYEIESNQELSEFISLLFSAPELIKMNISQHNRYSAALSKYYTYFCGEVFPLVSCSNCSRASSTIDETIRAKYVSLISEKFANGIRYDFSLELRNFKQLYQEMYGEIIEQNDDEIIHIIQAIGLDYNGRVYTLDSLLDASSRTALFDYINSAFSDGRKVLYYEALFSEFEEMFYSSRIFSTDMLKSYLEYCNNGSYFVQRSFITSKNEVGADPVDEVRQCMHDANCVMSYTDIEAALPFIPLAKIKQVLASYPEFIWVKTENYIHVNCVELSSSDLASIKSLIVSTIGSDGYMSGSELIREIQIQYPDIIEKNSLLHDSLNIGLRDVIKYHLINDFNFSGNIISPIQKPLSTWDVYANFCKHHESFTLASLEMLSDEIGTPIYFDAVYDNSLRICIDSFISKQKANFDIEAVDATIEKYCQGDYIAISEISSFALFPGIEYSWNGYLLEHYVYLFSHDYKILHAASFSAKGRSGAIVRRSSSFMDFGSLIADAIAKADVSLDSQSVLDYLVTAGYLGKRKYGDIESVIESAKQLRNQRGQR